MSDFVPNVLDYQSPPKPEGQMKIPARGAALMLAAVLLGAALQVSDGLYSIPGIALLAVSLLLCLIAVLLDSQRFEMRFELLCDLLMIFAIAQIIWMIVQAVFMEIRTGISTIGAGPEVVPLAFSGIWFSLLGLVPIGIVLIWTEWRGIAFAGFILLLAIHFGIGDWKIRSAPSPQIDVYIFHRDAAKATASGINPYTITFLNIYGDDTYVYGPNIVRDGRLLFGYPYPPLILMITSAAHLLLGDARYALLLCMELTAVMIVMIRPGRVGMLTAALLLFTPRTFYMLDMSWTEPISVMLLAGTVLCTIRAPKAAPVMLGLLIASKQYLPAALFLTALLRTPSPCTQGEGRGEGSGSSNDKNPLPDYRAREWGVWKFAGAAIFVALLVTLPFTLWDIRAFIHSTLTLQFQQPYRPDSLSFLAWFGSNRPNWQAPFWLAFVALGAGIALSLWRRASFPLAMSLSYFLFFAFNKQAFANYYYFVLGAIVCAIAFEARCANFAKNAQ